VILGSVLRLSHHERAARARAALAYADVPYKEIYEGIHVDRATFARKLEKKGNDKKSTLSDEDIAYIVKRTQVPMAWFTADFSRLEEIPMPRGIAELAEEAGQLRDGKSLQPPELDDDRPDSSQAA